MRDGFTFSYHDTPPLSPHASLQPYLSQIAEMAKEGPGEYDTREHALLLPIDKRIRTLVDGMAKKFAGPRLKYVFVIGIGGSNLGTKAVYDALSGQFRLSFTEAPQLYFLDTISSDMVLEVNCIISEKLTHPDEILINLISKSGSTAESIANFELVYHELLKRFKGAHSRVVCTTDVGSTLWIEATRLGFGLLPIPTLVGGRYSVFSTVGLFPLHLAGMNIDELAKGGEDMFHSVTLPDVEKNHALRAAEELFTVHHLGCSIINIFHFNPQLESLGKWERQLIAESLGKEKDLKGKVVRAGLTPIVSVGSTDLHSMAQLYFGGPRDKFTMLIRALDDIPQHMAKQGGLLGLVRGLGGKSPSDLMEAIYNGVCTAYKANALPALEVRLPDVSAYTIGAYMEWRMATIIYLAKLMHVNPFDQPNVEDYKTETRKILQRN